MLRKLGLFWLIVAVVAFSCKNSSVRSVAANDTKATAAAESSVSLKIEDAALVEDENDPDSNTAEWSFKVDHAGRYEVWLSSVTRDTLNMGFDTVVTITAGDSRLEKLPLGDKIIADATNAEGYRFKAESEMGSVFFNAPGDYTIQIISEKIKSPADKNISAEKEMTLIKSLILRPVVY